MIEFGYENEYDPLQSVILMFPEQGAVEFVNPARAMFCTTPSYGKLKSELFAFKKLLNFLGIETYVAMYNRYPNQVFVRDLAIVAPNGIILAMMRHTVRQGEELELLKFLGELGLGSVATSSPYYMEGADFFWLSSTEVVISVGNRTSCGFVGFFSELYPDVDVIREKAFLGSVPQHMLGCKHVLANDTLILRNELHRGTLGFKQVIRVKETSEIVGCYAANVVTVKPMEIIMPDGCPETRKLFESHGVTCHVTPMSEICKMNGGIACATLPLHRK